MPGYPSPLAQHTVYTHVLCILQVHASNHLVIQHLSTVNKQHVHVSNHLVIQHLSTVNKQHVHVSNHLVIQHLSTVNKQHVHVIDLCNN